MKHEKQRIGTKFKSLWKKISTIISVQVWILFHIYQEQGLQQLQQPIKRQFVFAALNFFCDDLLRSFLN